jgi:diguanylate cyclase (GGDEF)-like protein
MVVSDSQAYEDVVILYLPAVVSGVLLVVFWYLHEQSRAAYFNAWRLAWFCYCAAYGLDIYLFKVNYSAFTDWTATVLLAMVPLFIFASTRLVFKSEFPLRWPEVAILAGFLLWAWQNEHAQSLMPHGPSAVFLHVGGLSIPFDIYLGMAVLLFYSAFRFWSYGIQRGSLPFRLLSGSLVLWAVLLLSHQFQSLIDVFDRLGIGHVIGPIPQMIIGIAMVMVLYESERRTVQDSLLAFSSFEMETTRILEAADLEPAMSRMLAGMLAPLEASRGLIWIADSWRRILPGVQNGVSPELLGNISRSGGADYLLDLLGGGKEKLSFRDLKALHTGEFEDPRATRLQELLAQEDVSGLTVVSLQTRENNFGLVIVPHQQRHGYGSSQLRLLSAMCRQLSMTIENYALMQDAARRTEEFELLAQIGQVVSSRLDPDEVLRTVHRELGRLFDVQTFYVAFLEADELRFELEYEEGVEVPKRSRKATSGLSEYVVRTGEPLLVRNDMESVRARLGLVKTGTPSKCFCAVPIFMAGRSIGVMAALNYQREFIYEQRDLDVMKTAAGQVAVAMENARLFAEEQRRSKYLEFLNSVSKTAISSQEPDAMMAEIVGEIQKNFRFDHIGIGILDYASKDIEIKAEAGTTEKALGRRIPLGVGILGRVARTGELALVQNTSEGRLLGILPESKSVLSIPIAYGDTLLGVLNVESRRENAFAPQEVLIMRTLADLLATALHNAYVFQKMQQQSITDGLTGIKTRRFFNESLQSEWKRASRSGRPFSIVLIDLDKFKTINDSMGHLEGDLVLARVGRILEQKSRQSNVVARYGGDEFVILMPETGVEQAQILSERLRLWIATDTMLNERQITGSFGVATFPAHGASAEDILRIADMGMYNAKRSGGNRVSTPEDFQQSETPASLRPAASYVESFLQREELGPESIDDLVSSLARLQASVAGAGAKDVVLEAIRMLGHAAEAREVAGAGHGDLVAEHAEAIGRELGMPEDDLNDLVQAARFHDIGKVLISPAILNKEQKLTLEEVHTLQQHPVLGARILGALPGAARAANIVRHHHERFDGSGYPEKLRGEAIPLGARILHVLEAYTHITLDRPYAAKRHPAQAMAELERMSGTQFDGMVVRVFLKQLKRSKALHTTASS